MKIEILKGAKVALLGLGVSQIDFVIGAENSKEWDEVWGINSVCGVFNCDRVFMMDPASRFFDTEDAGKQTKVLRRILPDLSVPVYTCELDDRVPSAELYPLEEVCNYTKSAYFNNTVAYAIAFAFYNEVDTLELYGIDFSYSNNMHLAEAGRACVEFWCAKTMDGGMKIGVSPRSGLLDANVPITERLYGYHRLEDPYVAVPLEDKWVIEKNSKINEVLKEENMSLMKEPPKPPEPYKG